MYILDLDVLWHDRWLTRGVLVCPKCGNTYNAEKLKKSFPLLFEMDESLADLQKELAKIKIGQ